MKLQGAIEEIRKTIATLAPSREQATTYRAVEQHPEVVKACRSSKTKARRHIERLLSLGVVKTDGAAQMPRVWVE